MLGSTQASNSTYSKSSYLQVGSGHLDSSWIASRSIQSFGLDVVATGSKLIVK